MPENHSGGGLVKRMRTAKAIALAVGFSGLSALFSGCETTNGAEDPGAGLAVLGMLAGFKGNQMAAQGNYQAAASGAALQDLAYGAANYQRQRAVAEAGRSEVNVNVPQQQPQPVVVYQQPQYQSEQQPRPNNRLIIYVANGRKDKNGDGIVQLDEIEGYEKNKLGTDEPIEVGIYGINIPELSAKFIITSLNDSSIIRETSVFTWRPNEVERILYQPNTFVPGAYKFAVELNGIKDSMTSLFEVTGQQTVIQKERDNRDNHIYSGHISI